MRCRLLAACLASLLAACGGGEDLPNTPPVAVDDAVTTAEDTPVVIPVLDNDHDADLDDLEVRGASAPGHQVAVEGRVVRVTPAADFHGTIEVSYEIGDGRDRASARAMVTVTPVNDPPVAQAATVTTGRNAAAVVALAARDVDGDPLTLDVVAAPAHGSLSGEGVERTYTPARDFVGDDAFTFRARDASGASAQATVQVTVVAGQAPVAQARTLTTAEDVAVAVTLAASDGDGDPVSFAIATPPAHGALTGTPPDLTYTPAADFHGADHFTYTASDGVLTSAPATVALTVAAVDDAPRAQAAALTVSEDHAVEVTLAGTDADGDALTYAIVEAPAHGTLDGTGAARTYTPAANYHGADRFTFTVSDGRTTSAPAAVELAVTAIEDLPAAQGGSAATREDTALALTLVGSDGDGDPLVFTVTVPPAHGVLTGTPPAVTYTPAADFHGSDALSFTVGDGDQTSAAATVQLTVAAVDDAPVVAATALTTAEGVRVALPLPATDVDGQPLTYSFPSLPAHGSIYGSGAAREYGPCCHYSGGDSFTVQASDGTSTSAPATFTVTITPVDDPPLVRDDLAIATPGQSLRIDVLANDEELDGQPLSIDSVAAPTHGSIEIVDDALVYVPAAGAGTTDTFTYTVADPGGLAATGTVRVGIGELPRDLPVRSIGRVVHAADSYAQVRQHDVSADGRYFALASPLALVAADTNGVADIYLYDRLTARYQRVSVAADGGPADAASGQPSVSDDGRYVAFASSASNLVAGDSNGVVDVFVRDRETGVTVRASVGPGGAQGSGASLAPELSADGQVLVFTSSAFQLVADDANGAADVFVRDLAAGVTARVSVSSSGGEADLASRQPALSGDGRVVAFVSAASNLVAGDGNGDEDVFVHDRVTGVTERVSVGSTGGEANAPSGIPTLSRDGRFVAFQSAATNLVPGASTGGVFVRDRQGITTIRAANHASGLTLSGDGRYLVGHTSTGACFVRDRFAATVHWFSTDTGNDIYFPVISANGRYVAVLSNVSLVPGGSVSGTTLFALPNPL